ncbi:PAS domain S-box protein [Brevundimonas sp.]|uniref:PAS domain S-box protein n=1 Tax=Brevundimonas sp. TaxID=1871086 RepID=UPI00286C104D|nr:PAS domain S-box protein [Brevundimonas sp.]
MADDAPLAGPEPRFALSLDILTLIADAVICTDDEGRVLVFNAAAERSFGYSAAEVMGHHVNMLLPDSDRLAHREQMQTFALRAGPSNRLMGHRREVRGRRKNGEVFPAEAMVSRQTIAGKTILTVVHRDISERKELEELREAVGRELDHRLKNVLSVVNSLVAISAGDAVSVADFQKSLTGRLNALAATQNSLRSGDQYCTSLGDLLRGELEQYQTLNGAHVVLEGPTVPLGPKAAQLLALVVHELATNAAKYGALSDACGRLTVISAFEADGDEQRLVIEWREAGGPPVKPPQRQGFGSRLIKKVVAKALRAAVAMDYRPEGLTCRISVPRRMLEADP